MVNGVKMFLFVAAVVAGVVTMGCVVPDNSRSVTAQGMAVQWRVVENQLAVTVYAPTRGWVAIGFNTQDQLMGTNLIMGAVADGRTIVDDRYILKPGEHKSIRELGGQYALSNAFGVENEGGTTVFFTLSLHSSDSWHHTLEEGKEYVLLMAYSQEDDFRHHSHMRTSVRITL